jgi:hypothetical protein
MVNVLGLSFAADAGKGRTCGRTNAEVADGAIR